MARTLFELEMLQRTTKSWLESDGETITLSRVTSIADGAGGFGRDTPTARSPQPVVLESSNRQLPQRRTVDGIEVQPEYTMVGMWDADINRGDWFYKDGIKYEVVFVDDDKSYQTTAEVIYRG
jgi:hypothetical protein